MTIAEGSTVPVQERSQFTSQEESRNPASGLVPDQASGTSAPHSSGHSLAIQDSSTRSLPGRG